MFDWFKRSRKEREIQLQTLQAVAEALRDSAAERRSEALRTEAMLAELREQRLQDQEAFVRMLQSISDNSAKVVEGVTGAVTAQANALTQHLKLFESRSEPQARTVRDEDEYRAEIQRTYGSELPEEELAALLQLEQGLVSDIDLR
jgi:hexokinase